jgi:hypothetical protein
MRWFSLRVVDPTCGPRRRSDIFIRNPRRDHTCRLYTQLCIIIWRSWWCSRIPSDGRRLWPSFRQSEEFPRLCVALGDRLVDAGDTKSASLCYMCSLNLERTVRFGRCNSSRPTAKSRNLWISRPSMSSSFFMSLYLLTQPVPRWRCLSGRSYCANQTTGETKWERPQGAPVAQPGNIAARKSAARSLSQSSHGSTGAGASTQHSVCRWTSSAHTTSRS